MIDPTQATLIRSVLKIGAGAFVTKGIMDEATSEIIISGLVAMVAVVWGYLEKRNKDVEEKAKNVPIKTLLFLVTLSLGVAGCSHLQLEPDGVYGQDKTLAAADSSFKLAHVTLTAAFDIEKANRDFFWKISPKIKREMDEIRVKAAAVGKRFAIARDAYIAAPIPKHMSELEDAITELQRFSAVATTLITDL